MIICTYNRAHLLADALQSMCQQSIDSAAYEIIVIDNNSTEQTYQVTASFIQQYPHVRYYRELRQGLSHARNRGWHEAQGDYIAYIDDDCKAPPHWLATAQKIIQDVAPTGFGGPYLAFYKTAKPAWFKDEYGSHTPYPTATFLNAAPDALHGGNLFLQRQVLAQVGGFDPKLGMVGTEQAYGEETALLRHLRVTVPEARFYFEPDLYLYHLVRPEKMQLGWLVRDHFARGRALNRVYNKANSSNRYWGLSACYMLLLAALVISDGVVFALLRRRSQYPYIQNYWYESSLDHIKTLGRLYQELWQTVQSNKQQRGRKRATLQQVE